MEERLAKYMYEIVEALKQGIDFAGEQAPLFIQEYLSYATYHHTIIIVCMLLIFVIMLFGVKATYNKYQNQSYLDDWQIGIFLTSLGACAPLGIAVYNALQLIKISIAPRVYLIEEISKLI